MTIFFSVLKSLFHINWVIKNKDVSALYGRRTALVKILGVMFIQSGVGVVLFCCFPHPS